MARRQQRSAPQNNQINLSGNLGTASTVQNAGPQIGYGTGQAQPGNINFVPAPAPVPQPVSSPNVWSIIERGAVIIGLLGTFGALLYFFFRLDTNVDSIKGDVKDLKQKIEKIDETSSKQGSGIEKISDAMRRVEDQTNRNTDFLRSNDRGRK